MKVFTEKIAGAEFSPRNRLLRQCTFDVPAAADLSQVVKSLNALGATAQDLIGILQAIKAAGALKADLEII